MRIALPSFHELYTTTLSTLSRFPILSVLLLLGAGNHLYMDIFKNQSFALYSRNLFMSIVLLLPLLFSLKLCHESHWIGVPFTYFLQGLGLMATGFYVYTLPNSELLVYHFSQFVLYFSVSILCCFVCVKDCFKDDAIFWHFYLSIFTRINISVLYTAVILGGSSAALGAIDLLFKTNLLIHQEIRIVIVTLWIFTPLFFLTRVPRLNNVKTILLFKPPQIKNIALYVLIPLTILYLAILYVYMGKIILQRALPEGMVSYLVLSFAAFGITTLVIISAFQNDKDIQWTHWFNKWFYVFQLPLLVLLSVAIFRRINDYGITLRRYYVLVLALWLLCLSLLMIFHRKKKLVAIPATLLIFAIFSSFGPWNGFRVSWVNQKSRLDSILKDNGLIHSGKLIQSATDLPDSTKSNICSIAKYLFDYRRLNTYSAVLAHNDSLTPQIFTRQLGFEYTNQWQSTKDTQVFSYTMEDSMYDIESQDNGFFATMTIQAGNYAENKIVEARGNSVTYRNDSEEFVVHTVDGDSLVLTMKTVFNTIGKFSEKKRIFPIVFENDVWYGIALFQTITGRKTGKGIKLDFMKVDFFMHKKSSP